MKNFFVQNCCCSVVWITGSDTDWMELPLRLIRYYYRRKISGLIAELCRNSCLTADSVEHRVCTGLTLNSLHFVSSVHVARFSGALVQTFQGGPLMTKNCRIFSAISLIRPYSHQNANMFTCKLQWQTDKLCDRQNSGVLNHLHALLRIRAFLTIQSFGGDFPTSPSTCPISPLVTADAPPVFCPFQLRSVTSDRH